MSQPGDYNRQLFGDIEKFIQITIEGKEYTVPEKLELLRVFQFLEFEIDYARLCWNGSCQRCFVAYEAKGKTVDALSCRAKSVAGMNVLKLPPTIKAVKA